MRGVSGDSVRIEAQTNSIQTNRVGDGLGGHEARISDAGGRSIGRMIVDGIKFLGQKIGNFLAKIGDFFKPKVQTARVDDLREPMLDKTNGINQTGGGSSKVDDLLKNVNSLMQYMPDLSVDSFIKTCIQCMDDGQEGQDFLTANLDNPDYSKEKFTGIEGHPTDSSKFIAKFGENQLVFSNRGSSNKEFRGAILQDKLKSSDYTNLRDLMAQNHGTELDSLLSYSTTPLRETLRSASPNLSGPERQQLLEAVQDRAIGPFVFGAVCDLSFLDD